MSGFGVINIIIGIVDVMIDSILIVVIVGQVGIVFLGIDVFQEVDLVGIMQLIIKWSYQICCVEDVLWVVVCVFYIVKSGCLGLVVFDFVKNVQVEKVEYMFVKFDFICSYVFVFEIDLEVVKVVVELINGVECLLVLVG